MKMANVLQIGQVHPHRHQHHRRRAHQDQHDGEQHPAMNSGHGIWPLTIPVLTSAMRPACGAGSAVAGSAPGAPAKPYAEPSSASTRQRGGGAITAMSSPSPCAGRAAQDVPDLEVLHHVPGDPHGAAHHGRHAQHRQHPLVAAHPDGHHEERRQDQRGERQAADGVVAAPDQPTRYPATAANRIPATTMTTAARTEPPKLWVK
jgi:hypothetical protein